MPVSPTLASANNGNWHTAKRWARCLVSHARVRIEREWSGADDDLMIGFHARRSVASIAAFAAWYPARPVALVLTGTDLYRDIRVDAQAQRSLMLASRLILQRAEGLHELLPGHAATAMVICQSASLSVATCCCPRAWRVVPMSPSERPLR